MDSSVHGDSSGKNTGVCFYALLQEIFPTPCLLHWQTDSLLSEPPGNVPLNGDNGGLKCMGGMGESRKIRLEAKGQRSSAETDIQEVTFLPKISH